MLFFPEINGKTLSLTWSKKNSSYRAKGPPPKPKPKPKPRRAGRTAAAARAWGAILSSEAVYTLMCLRLIYTSLFCSS